MAEFYALDAINDRERWDAIIAKLPSHAEDVFFSSSYARSVVGERRVKLLVYEAKLFKETHICAQPVAISSIMIGDEWKDMVSLPGFGGPVSTLDGARSSEHFYLWFRLALTEWAKSEGIVSEFCLLHPMLRGYQHRSLRSADLTVKKVKEAVLIDVQRWAWADVKPNRKESYRKAIASGAEVVREHGGMADVEKFAEMYQESMVRLGASERWRLSKSEIGGLCRLPGAILTFGAVDGVVKGGALFLVRNGVAYYHLAARQPSKIAVNDVILIDFLTRMGEGRIDARYLFLGGGVRSDEDDSLLMYKKSFGGDLVPVSAYFSVLDARRYEHLCANKEALEAKRPGARWDEGFEPKYRRGMVA